MVVESLLITYGIATGTVFLVSVVCWGFLYICSLDYPAGSSRRKNELANARKALFFAAQSPFWPYIASKHVIRALWVTFYEGSEKNRN